MDYISGGQILCCSSKRGSTKDVAQKCVRGEGKVAVTQLSIFSLLVCSQGWTVTLHNFSSPADWYKLHQPASVAYCLWCKPERKYRCTCTGLTSGSSPQCVPYARAYWEAGGGSVESLCWPNTVPALGNSTSTPWGRFTGCISHQSCGQCHSIDVMISLDLKYIPIKSFSFE